MYPKDWPRCPRCGDFAMDGHITCGRFECNESSARDARAYGEWCRNPKACAGKGYCPLDPTCAD